MLKEEGFHALYNPSLLYAMRNIKDAVFTNTTSRSFGNPTNKTLLHAVRHNWIDIPGLTGKILSRNPPLSTATSQGHLDLIRQGLKSTQPTPPSDSPPSILGPVLRSESLTILNFFLSFF